MPQGNDYFRDTKEAMRMFIPVVLNERNLQLQRDRMAQHDKFQQENIAGQERKLQEDAKRRVDEYTLRTLGGLAEKFIAEGDTENLKKLAPHFQKYGIDFSDLSAINKPEKGPANEWDALNRWSGGDPEKAAALHRKFHPDRSDKSMNETELLWSQSGRDINKYAELKNLTNRQSGGGGEKIPAEVQVGLRVLQMKPTDTLDPMMATFMDAIQGPGSSQRFMEQQQKTGRGDLTQLQALAAPIVQKYLGQTAGGGAGMPAPGKAPAGEMKEMPPAAQHKGRTLVNKATGERFKSDGTQWVPLTASNKKNAWSPNR